MGGTMSQSKLSFSCLTLVMLSMLAACQPQPDKLASANLWTDGAWALYDIDRLNTDGTVTKGTLRVAAVGKEMLDNQLHLLAGNSGR